MNDIISRNDIELLVNAFYKKVVIDPVISHFFTKVAHFSWDVHIPIMVSFWESILLPPGTYTGNPMVKHIELNRLSPLQQQHFDQWMHLWKETVNELYSGPVADMAVTRATSIAGIMQHKIVQV